MFTLAIGNVGHLYGGLPLLKLLACSILLVMEHLFTGFWCANCLMHKVINLFNSHQVLQPL